MANGITGRALVSVAASLLLLPIALPFTARIALPAEQAPAPQSSSSHEMEMGGHGMMGGMMEGKGMMGGKQESGRMMMCGCPCPMMGAGMMGMGPITSGDPAMAARMLEMRAEMMKSDAAIMEKYARQMSPTK